MSNIYDLADTWNAGGTTFAAIKMNVTNTASAAGSQLIDLQTGGTQRFGIRAPHISLGSDATPFLNLVDVWNTSGVAVGIKYNVTDTASNASSLLMDLQVGGASKFRVAKSGLSVADTPDSGALFASHSSGWGIGYYASGVTCGTGISASTYTTATKLQIASSNALTWAANGWSATEDLALFRDAANTLAQRRGANAQTFRIYNTYTDASNYERGFFRWASNILEIGAEAGGTGTARSLKITGGGSQVYTFTSGAVELLATNTFCVIGHSSARMRVTGAGVWAVGDASVAPSSAYPAFKRSGTILQSRLADDSDFATWQGKLRVHANAVTETIVPTQTIRLFDAAGTEYKVPCIPV